MPEDTFAVPLCKRGSRLNVKEEREKISHGTFLFWTTVQTFKENDVNLHVLPGKVTDKLLGSEKKKKKRKLLCSSN